MRTPLNSRGFIISILVSVVLLSGCPTGFYLIPPNDTDLGPPGDDDPPVTVGPYLTGTVRFNDLPIAGADVEIADSDFVPTISQSSTTGADGAYQVSLFPFIDAGIADVWVWVAGPSGYSNRGTLLYSILSTETDISMDYIVTKRTSITSPQDGAINVSVTPTVVWNIVPEAETYDLGIWRGAGGGSYWLESRITGLVGSSHTISSGFLDLGTEYRIDLVGHNANGTEVASAFGVVFTTQ